VRIGEVRNPERAQWGKPLTGVRLLAAEPMQALPFATQLMGYLGAEVTKVEHPEHGESGRGAQPSLIDEDGRRVGATYLRNNLSKRSVGIDLKKPQGRDLFKRLVPHFDIVAENFTPGTMQRLGLGYDVLSQIDPRIIYLSISGFGNRDDSPYARWPAYAPIVEAMAGIYEPTRKPGEPPPTLFEYLPENALLIVDESHVTVPQLGAMYKGDRSRKETLVEHGFRLPSALDNRPLRFDEFERLSPQTIYVSATPGDYEKEHADNIVEQLVRPTGLVDPAIDVRPASTQVDDVLSEIGKRVAVGERVLITTLTKRMSEDLADYLQEHGVRVRYLHSDIGTVERTEIIRDLRLGTFDVLVGINLLREGLDMPEVSLVAILDADKEGFLRAERSLIQTIGRAARNVNGMVIMYADRVTGSMERAIAEMDRRRNKQIEYNEIHGITPQTIRKEVRDIMEGARSEGRGRGRGRKVAEPKTDYRNLTPERAMQRIKKLEKTMYQHARDLEFEEAARLRDEIDDLRRAGFGLPAAKAG